MRYTVASFERFVIVARIGCTSTEIRAECEPIRRSESLSPRPIRTPQPSRRTSIRPAIDCTCRRAPSRDSGASRSPAPGGPPFASTMATRMTSTRSTTTGTERKRWRCRFPLTPAPAFARWRLGRFPKRRQYGWYPPDPIRSKPDLLVRPHHDQEERANDAVHGSCERGWRLVDRLAWRRATELTPDPTLQPTANLLRGSPSAERGRYPSR